MTNSCVHDLYYQQRENIYSINYESFASELLENLEEMFPRNYIAISLDRSNTRPHNSMLPVAKGLNTLHGSYHATNHKYNASNQ